jgi:NADH-quinone oxidoreductase subunit H
VDNNILYNGLYSIMGISGAPGIIAQVVAVLVGIAVVLGVILLHVAYATYFERKVIGHMQLRLGPMRVGWHGLLQPIADGLKLFFKEDIIPATDFKTVFRLAPIYTLFAALSSLAVIPFFGTFYIANINVGILYIFAISAVSTYGIIMAGWASNSKYAFLGAMRSAAQLISYEVAMGLSLVGVMIMSGSLNLIEIVNAQQTLWYGMYLIPQFLGFFVFTLAAFAETNRVPFDLPEAETELVAGYFAEYSGMRFSLFFLGEYVAMIVMSSMSVICFFGGWTLPPFLTDAIPQLNLVPGIVWFTLKIYFHIFVFYWVRATLPRYRYDYLMRLGWKVLIPLALANIVITSIIKYLA